ncbi:diguanylate cyclase domain-containing protein [Acetobacterium sp.]|uniref:diguanylate cyclase domain-containing protein n=1 Tax=Acetobacterium sp. TaxID=1872094 RepID=UPI002F3F9024
MLGADNIQTILFAILCICFVFYLFMGIYNYQRDHQSKINVMFLILSISTSLWAIGYAFMLISPNIEIANSWRIVSALGWCFFSGVCISIALYFIDTNQKKSSSIIRFSVYIVSIIFFISNLIYEPSQVVSKEAYGFVDNLYITTTSGTIFSIYIIVAGIAVIVMTYFHAINSQKNRVRKQLKIILIAYLMTFCLFVISNFIFPLIGIVNFPYGIITISIAMSGVWYAITRYKMMSISYELVSEYIFDAVNEPIFILGEDFLVKNCNEASLNLTGVGYKDLKQHSLDNIINFRNFNFNTLMQIGNMTNIEVDLHNENQETIVCELSATVISDEYKDILGILILLHDVSERKKLAIVQRENTLILEEKNRMLKNEIKERLLAEDQIRHFIYYDALTELSNRKKMLEDIEVLLDDENEKFAILFIDLDHFKSINDNYGHEAGDIVLKNVALRLKKIICATNTISRIGGDEFIVILRNLKNSIIAEKTAAAVVETLRAELTYKKNQLFIGSSIGMSIFPDHGIDADMLINKADFAMYEVKHQGGNGFKMYTSEIKEEYV